MKRIRSRTAARTRQTNGPAAPRPAVPLKERRLAFGQKWDYAPAPEAFEYIRIEPRQQLFIGGKFTAPCSGKYFDSLNPATEEKLSEIAVGDARDVDEAVKAARRAFQRSGAKRPAVSGASICIVLRGSSRKRRAS